MKLQKIYPKISSIAQGKCFKILLSKAILKSGDNCVDISCGSGNVTTVTARTVGTNGEVARTEPNKQRIMMTQMKNSYESIKYLEEKVRDINFNLQKSSLDVFFCDTVYH